MFDSKSWYLVVTTMIATPLFWQTDRRQDTHVIESAVLQVVETIDIPATASGPLISMNVNQGALILAGQILATVENEDALIKLRESEIELEIVKAQSESNVDIEFAKKSRLVALADYRRARESNQAYAGVVSDREMDRLKLLVEQSAAELEKIKFEKTLLQMQLQLKRAAIKKNNIAVLRHEIKSTISGQIVEISKRQGEWVNASDTVFQVMRLDRLRVEEYLPVEVASNDILGANAIFKSLGSKRSEVQHQGKVVFVSPEINPLNSTVQVWIEFENSDLKLRPGLKGQVSIKTKK